GRHEDRLRPVRGRARRNQHRDAAGPGDVPRRDRARVHGRGQLDRPRPGRGNGVHPVPRRLRDADRAELRREAPRRHVRDRLAVRDRAADRHRHRAGAELLHPERSVRCDAGGGRHSAHHARHGRRRLCPQQGPQGLDAAAVVHRPRLRRPLVRAADLLQRRQPDPQRGHRDRLVAAHRRELQLPAQARHGRRRGLDRDRHLRLDRQHLPLAAEPLQRL
ncbi:MAG: hypothetical protein AVDCRST_MAG67-3254, partial [uncultured Solirubrobacteraceae bacterium]